MSNNESKMQLSNDFSTFNKARSPEWLVVMNPSSPGYMLEQLAASAPVALLERLAEHPNTPHSVLRQLSSHPHPDIRSAVTNNANVSEEIILDLCSDGNPEVRFNMAENHNLSPHILNKLTNDDNPYVSERAKRTLNRLSSQINVATQTDHHHKVKVQSGSQADMNIREKLKILVIEDNPADVKLLQKLLENWPYELICADRLSTGLEYLSQNTVELILLDLSLPDAQGLDTFYHVHCQTPHIPIIVLTGLEDELIGIEAVQSGAQDYLIKGQVLPGLLGRSIKYAIERHQAETRIRQLNESLEQRVIQLATTNQELNKLAHGIRSLISTMLGVTGSVLQANTPRSNEEIKSLYERIDETVLSQLTLLDEIRNPSIIEAEKVEFANHI